MAVGPWYEMEYRPEPSSLSGEFEMRVRRLLISSTSWRDVLATIEDPVNGPARVEHGNPFGETVLSTPLDLVPPIDPPYVKPTTVGWTVTERVNDILVDGTWQKEYQVEWAYVMFRTRLYIPQGTWPELTPEETASFPPGWAWEPPQQARWLMPQFTSEFRVIETQSHDFVPGPDFDTLKVLGSESVKGASHLEWVPRPYTQWDRPSQLAERQKHLVLEPGLWAATPSHGELPDAFSIATSGGGDRMFMLSEPYVWSWPRWDVPPTPTDPEPTGRILSGWYSSRVEMTVHVDIPVPIREAFIPERRRYWYPGVSGQYRLRQRQTSTGADSWPLRQRQNGAHSGSWPLRQRQTGV